jgi:hypothetical protein
MWRMTRVIARPMIGTATGTPRATTAALSSTPRLTKPSVRAWLPSATSAALLRRSPARVRICAATSLPRKADHPGCGQPPEMDQRARLVVAVGNTRVARESARVVVVASGWWRIGKARLALSTDGVGPNRAELARRASRSVAATVISA